jgi:hypothetical protein
MRFVKRAMILLLALGSASLLGGRAQAQSWFGRPLSSWRAAAWSRGNAGGQLGGGDVVVGTSFATGGSMSATLNAAQWQQLVTAQASQTPMVSAAQWQQMVTGRAQLPPNSLLTPAQQFNILRAAAAQQQQQQFDQFAEALRQLQQQQNAPPHPPINVK